VGTEDGVGMGMTVRGIRYLPDNKHLVFADRGSSSLVRLNLDDFSKETTASGFNEPNGVAVDPDGNAYLTGADQTIVRIDPMSGKTDTLYTSEETTDGIAFSPDFKTLYFDSEMGNVYKMPLNDDGTAGDVTLLATIFQGEGILDGLTTDICGNVYVVDMEGTIWRVSPDGEKEMVVELGGDFINAVNFGSGKGGWKADALYIGGMSGAIHEVELGVIGAPQPHL
jgi:sugar lactone lactonase YvrE